MDSIQSSGQAQYNIMCHTINPKDVQYPEHWPSMLLVFITEVTLARAGNTVITWRTNAI